MGTNVTSYVSDPQIVELPPASQVKLGKVLDVMSESNTQQSMFLITDGVMVAAVQGSVTVTVTTQSEHELGLAVTHEITLKMQLPASAIRVGAALIVYVPDVDVEEVAT